MEENSKLPRILKLANPLKDSTDATFFLVVSPGFEVQAQKEAEAVLGARRMNVVTGGIQFDSTWGEVRLGQPRLRFASRVLVRVDQFGARDFQKLFRKVSNLPWEDWLKPKTGLSVRAASHASRLRIKAGIEESVVDAFKKSFKAPPPRPTQEVMCLVRVEDDICTLSLDLSGDLLHKRGSHTDVGVAPLRETWAASIVDRVFDVIKDDADITNSFSKGWEWIEPMAGTAVFLREALASEKSEKPSADSDQSDVDRTFALDTCFKFERDEKLDAKLKSKPKAQPPVVNADLLKSLTQAVISDRNEAQLARAKKALAGYRIGAKIDYVVESIGDSIGPALDKKKSSSAWAPRLVIVNPPWGQRLKGKEATNTAEAQTKLMSSIETKWQPTVIALVFPRIAGTSPKVPKGWSELPALDFRAGGLPVKARFFKVPERSVRKR